MAGPQVVIEMSGKEARLWRAQQRIIQQQVQVETGYRRVGQSARESGQEAAAGAQQSSAGVERVVGSLASMAATYVGISRGFSAVIGAAREAQEEVKGVVEQLKETYDVSKRIWQISEGKQAYETLGAKYKLAMASEGISRPAAEGLTFSAVSLGEEAAIPQIAATARYTDPEAMATFLGQMRSRTAWGKDVATPEQAFAGLNLAAKVSKLNIEESADVLGRGASAWARMGASPQETMATMAGISPAFASAELTATGMRALEAGLSKWRDTAIAEGDIEKEDAQGILGTLQTWKRVDPESYEEVMLGNVLFKVSAAALETPETQAMVGDMRKRIEEQFKTGAMYYEKIGDRPPDLTRQQRRTVAEAQKGLALEPLANKQQELETVRDQLEAVAASAGKPLAIEKMWGKVSEQGATFGMAETATEAMRQRLADMIQTEFPETFQQYIQPSFPARHKTASEFVGGGGMFGGGPIERTAEQLRARDIPRELSEAQGKAMTDALYAISRQKVVERAGVDPGIFPAAQGQVPLPITGSIIERDPITSNIMDEAAEVAGLPAATPPMRRGPSSMRMNPNQAKFYEDLNQQMRAADPGAYGYVPDQPPTTKAPGVPTADDALAQLNENYAAAERAGPTDTGGGADLADTLLQLRRQQNAVPSAAPAAVPTADDAVAQLNRNYAAAEQAPPATGPAPTWPTPAVEQVASGMLGPDDIREFGVSTQDLKEAAGALRGLRDQATMGRVGLGSPDRDQ